MQGEHALTTPGCAPPSFRQFTWQPFILGVQDMVFQCGDHENQARSFDFFHVEPASPCLFTDAGLPVFDYVIRCAARRLLHRACRLFGD